MSALDQSTPVDPRGVVAALRAGGVLPTDVDVQVTDQAPIGIGATADTFRLGLAGAPGVPGSVVAKVPARDAQAAQTAASMGLYDREVLFYERLAPQVTIDVPALLGVLEIEGQRAGVLLEDLSSAARVPDQLTDADPALIAQARTHLAALQAPFWDHHPSADDDWLHRRLGVPIDGIVERMARSWAISRDRIAGGFTAAQRDVIERFVLGAGAWSEQLTGPFTLTHHDYRLDNMLVVGDRVVILDWQTVGWGVPLFDVAYLLGTSWSPSLRRARERDEIARYVDDLGERGVEWNVDEAWTAYRRAAFAILLMLVPPTGSVKRSDRSDDMFRRLLAFGAQQVLDLDSLDFLQEA